MLGKGGPRKPVSKSRQAAPGTDETEKIDSSTAQRKSAKATPEVDQSTVAKPGEKTEEVAAPQAFVDQSTQYKERK